MSQKYVEKQNLQITNKFIATQTDTSS